MASKKAREVTQKVTAMATTKQVTLKVRLFVVVVVGCHGNEETPPCPLMHTERTQGAGYALDYRCLGKQGHPMIDGYVEWPSEMHKEGDFPNFCPLTEAKAMEPTLKVPFAK